MTRDDVIRKVQALLRVADGEANENESALALEMAQRLADSHNLDIDTVGQSGTREDAKVKKGFYNYQRMLYRSMANINHCMCWVSPALPGVKGSRSTVRIVGSQVNVAITKNQCSYVEQVANRLVRERYESSQFLSRRAHYFREGLIERLVQRIKQKRREEERAREELKRKEQEQHAGSATAIVLISDVAKAEERANYDFLYGEGAWDKAEALREKYRQEQRDTEAAYEQWKVDHPKEYAKQLKQQEREAKKERTRLRANARARAKYAEEREHAYTYRAPRESKYDSDDYYQGQEEGEQVSLDEQIDDVNTDKHQRLKGE